ncbi:hypothetical protein D3C81_1416960 [compost metagenome]
MVRVDAIPVVQVGRHRGAAYLRIVKQFGHPAHDGKVRVASRAQVGQIKRGRHAHVFRMAAVVQRQPAPLRIDEVDAAPRAGRLDDVREIEFGFLVTLQDGRALRIVADEVDELAAQAQRVATERHAIARVRHVVADGRHVDGVGDGQLQVGDAHDGVDAGAADNQNVIGTHGAAFSNRTVPAAFTATAPSLTI